MVHCLRLRRSAWPLSLGQGDLLFPVGYGHFQQAFRLAIGDRLFCQHEVGRGDQRAADLSFRDPLDAVADPYFLVERIVVLAAPYGALCDLVQQPVSKRVQVSRILDRGFPGILDEKA